MRVNSKFKINASIDKVFECLTNIDFLKSEMSRQMGNERPKIHYDKKSPFNVGNKIILIKGETKLILQIQQNLEPKTLEMNVWVEGKYKELVGMLYWTVNLEQVGKKTIYDSSLKSEKSLGGVISIGMKVYLWCAMFSSNRRFKKHVQSKNE